MRVHIAWPRSSGSADLQHHAGHCGRCSGAAVKGQDAVHIPGAEVLHTGSADPCVPDLRHREPAGTELRRQRPDFEHPAG